MSKRPDILDMNQRPAAKRPANLIKSAMSINGLNDIAAPTLPAYQYLKDTPTRPPLPILPQLPPAQKDWELSCQPAQVSTTTPSENRDSSPTPTSGATNQTLLCWSRPTWTEMSCSTTPAKKYPLAGPAETPEGSAGSEGSASWLPNGLNQVLIGEPAPARWISTSGPESARPLTLPLMLSNPTEPSTNQNALVAN